MALPFTIGNALLTCGQGSNDGNFGTLKFQTTGQWQETARNIAVGLDHGLDTFPTPVSNYLCSRDQPAAGALRAVAQRGHQLRRHRDRHGAERRHGRVRHRLDQRRLQLLRTADQDHGRHRAVPPTAFRRRSRCWARPSTTTRCPASSPNTTTNVGQITGSTYTLPGPVLDQKIWSSPRMVFVPVLGIEPSSGGSNKYQIIDFRPGFITDQTETAVKNTVDLGQQRTDAQQQRQRRAVRADRLLQPERPARHRPAGWPCPTTSQAADPRSSA